MQRLAEVKGDDDDLNPGTKGALISWRRETTRLGKKPNG
jgi:hypothetical protein